MANMRRGSSGATITVTGDDVMKRELDGDRVAEQGRWLQRYASPALPHVYRTYTMSYVMERLAVPPIGLLNHDLVMRTMVNQLVTHIWSRPAVMPSNHDMLFTKIERLINNYEFGNIWAWIYEMRSRVRWARLHICLTHGDPTFDNVLIREQTGELVLADPIPATLVVPDVRAVDTGKILQSVLGWEESRYGTGEFRFNVSSDDLHGYLTHRVDGFDDNEWLATIFWCVVHLLRTLPYVGDHMRVDVRRLIGAALTLL